MAKPAVTFRGTKGSPLTNDELDTNLENLRDATITLTADTAGTAVVSDLNGNITLVAGNNITLTGDNTAKTITIEGVAGANDALENNTIELGANDTVQVNLQAPTGYSTKDLRLYFDNVIVESPSGTNLIQMPDSGSIICFDGTTEADESLIQFDGPIIELETVGSSGQVQINSPQLDLQVTNSEGVECTLLLGTFTTTERNALATTAGSIIFNTTTSKFQGYDGTSWVDLN